jgi:hypothetical protein
LRFRSRFIIAGNAVKDEVVNRLAGFPPSKASVRVRLVLSGGSEGDLDLEGNAGEAEAQQVHRVVMAWGRGDAGVHVDEVERDPLAREGVGLLAAGEEG